jgi:hypothetical protein
MPDPSSDADQLRFAQIRGRMLDGLVEHLPSHMVEAAGVETRAEFGDKLKESDAILNIVEVCAFVAQTIEKERTRASRT